MKIIHTLTIISTILLLGCESNNIIDHELISAPDGMVLIESKDKSFGMGRDDVDDPYSSLHTVKFSYNFYMDTTEVTIDDYNSLMRDSNYGYKGYHKTWGDTSPYLPSSGSFPVYKVNWFDAVLYCNARSKKDGFDTLYSYDSISGTPGNLSELLNIKVNLNALGYRLPSEAEWEFACRAGTSTRYYWGDSYNYDTLKNYTWYAYNAVEAAWTEPHAEKNGPQLVATRLPNDFGLYDMLGNVYEWCNDYADYNYYDISPTIDPFGPQSGDERILRGGSYFNLKEEISTTRRKGADPTNSYPPFGFRVVLSLK